MSRLLGFKSVSYDRYEVGLMCLLKKIAMIKNGMSLKLPFYIFLVFTISLILLLYYPPITIIFDQIPIDYTEGWNAFWSLNLLITL